MSGIDSRVGGRIAEFRRAADLTQAQLAEKVGVATETISRLERGIAVPSLGRLEEIAQALAVELADFFVAGPSAGRQGAEQQLRDVVRRLKDGDVRLLVEIGETLARQRGRRRRG